MLIRKKLTAAEFSPPNLRYNIACSCVQFTPDGGVTWYDQPANDPRTSIVYQFPPGGGDDPRCDAAANMARQLEISINGLVLSVSEAAAAGALIDIWLVFMPGINILYALIWAVVEALIAIGTTVIAAAFDSVTYEDYKCICYCNIGDDGVVTPEILLAIKDDVDSLLGGTTAVVIGYAFQVWGPVGLTNQGTLRLVEGDCDDCECGWCYSWLAGDGFDPAWSLDFGSYNSGADTLDGTNTDPVTGNTVLLQAKLHFDSTVITYFALTFDYKSADTFGGNSCQIGNGTTYGANVFSQINPTPTFTTASTGLGGDSTPGALTDLWIQIGIPSKDALDTYLRTTQITIKGTGDCPFGVPNCEA